MVHRRDRCPHQNRTVIAIQTAVKMKLVFSQLVALYLEGQDIVHLPHNEECESNQAAEWNRIGCVRDECCHQHIKFHPL